jgi:hypothetical protein
MWPWLPWWRRRKHCWFRTWFLWEASMVSFTVDRGVLKLFAQLNVACPDRSKTSDGTVGDAAHSSRDSDHNPESPPPPGNPDDQVDAGDYTHDPDHGADMGVVSEAIRVSRDRRVSYLIFNDRITGPGHGWVWVPYNPDDPNRDRHLNHMHLSVNDVHHDETQDWSIGDVAINQTDFDALIFRVEAIEQLRVAVIGGPTKGEKVQLTKVIGDLTAAAAAANDQLKTITAALVALNAKIDGLQSAAGVLHVSGDLTVS